LKPETTYATASWVFLRLLGLVYLFAFWSLAQQIPGLIGHDGILPAAGYLADVREWADGTGVGLDRYRQVPTLFWLTSDDRVLQGVALAGVGLGAMLAAGIAPLIVLPLLWASYLSLAVVCRDFLAFQWDALLLEAGFLAICVAPVAWRHRLRDSADPPWLGRWLLWWLLFRLLFGSAVVKLASGDPTWRDFTALAVHYETQPLPTPLAWYAWALPLWFHKASTLTMFVIEIVVPWFLLAGLRWRRLAAVAFIALQALIALTGNYGFFNLLTVALCLLLLDDGVLKRVTPVRVSIRRVVPMDRRRLWLVAAVAVITVPVSAARFAGRAGVSLPPSIETTVDALRPFRSVNAYGLFAVMTTTRPEIVLEGSMDGVTWHEYEFRHKPGTLTRAPTLVAPFQPRLDWQMWFAALGRYEEEYWFQRFCERLLEGSPEVERLLAATPFSGSPPRFLRAVLYQYRYAERRTAGKTGAWWVRERIREYSPVLSMGAAQAQ
jgi:hypothetical protein